MWLKFSDAQKLIGLTKYEYFFSTYFSGEWVSSFKNTGDFVIRALCSDHVISSIKVSPHTYIIGLPDAQKQYTQKRLARASAVRFLALSMFFRAIKALDSISVLRMCEWSCGDVMTPQCHVRIPLEINMIFLDLPHLNGVKFYDRT